MHRQIYEYHPLVGYRFVPGITARVPHEGGGYLVRTNHAGFRCQHEVTTRKPPGTVRVLLFGDSFTAGEGVSDACRFGDLLERRWPAVQILNFGLPGTGTDQQYLIYREFARDLEYDLLLVCPLVENIRRVVSRYRLVISQEHGQPTYLPKPYFELTDGRLELRHVPVPRGTVDKSQIPSEDLPYVDEGGPRAGVRAFVNAHLRPLKAVIQAVSGYQPLPEYDDPVHPAWLLMKAIFTRWVAECGEHPVMVCPLPLYHHIEQYVSPDSYRRRFSELAALPRVTVHDPLPRFWAESPEGRRRCRFTRDQHLTPFGHQVLADALAPAIARFLGRGARR
jgi:hypothetical protein